MNFSSLKEAGFRFGVTLFAWGVLGLFSSQKVQAASLEEVLAGLGFQPGSWQLSLRLTSGAQPLVDRTTLRFPFAGYENLTYRGSLFGLFDSEGARWEARAVPVLSLGSAIPLFLQKKIADHFLDSCSESFAKGLQCQPFFEISSGFEVRFGKWSESQFLATKRRHLVGRLALEELEDREPQPPVVAPMVRTQLGSGSHPDLKLAIAHAFKIFPEKLYLKCLDPSGQPSIADWQNVNLGCGLASQHFPRVSSKVVLLAAMARLENDEAFQALLISLLTKEGISSRDPGFVDRWWPTFLEKFE